MLALSLTRRSITSSPSHLQTCSFRTLARLQKQHSLPAAYYRGGTSRAIIFQERHLPSNRQAWDPIFRSVIGSPDPNGRQLDGMGGGISSLSKVCIVGPSGHPDADVDYTFAAIGVKDTDVDYSSNCGNMTAAIGPFAVDSGLVKVNKTSRDAIGEAFVRIRNTNTGKFITAKFPVEDGEALAQGSFAIDGVAGTGAKVEMTFLNPSGSKTGRLLPTGSVTDVLDGHIVSCIDVGNPCVFIQASSLNVPGSILPEDIDAHPTLLEQLDSIRRKAGVAMGIGATETSIPGSIPKVAIVSKPHTHTLLSGEDVDGMNMDIVIRALSVGQPHRAVPITVAMAVAAASRLDGSIVALNTAEKRVDESGITIGHSSGRLLVTASFDGKGDVKDVSVFRTARRLMEGMVYWK